MGPLAEARDSGRQVGRRVKDARLFFAEDRPDVLSKQVLEFWDELKES